MDVRVGTRIEESLETLSETASDCADVTWSVRSFHMLAPVISCDTQARKQINLLYTETLKYR